MKQYKYYKKLRDKGYSHEDTKDFIHKSNRTLFRYLREYRDELEEEYHTTFVKTREKVLNISDSIHPWQVDPDTISDEDKVVGVISDIHLPATDMEIFKDVIRVFLSRGVNTIVCTGDMFDNYRISFHDSDPDALSEEDELDLSYQMVHELVNIFPYMVITEGNHSKLAKRHALKHGISIKRLRSYHELYDLPDTWKFVDSVIIDDVKYQHGDASPGGVHGGYNTAINEMMSSVVGHTHSNLDIKYKNNGNKIIFGATAGCLINKTSYAYRYNRAFKSKPIHGVVVVYNSQHAEIIPLEK